MLSARHDPDVAAEPIQAGQALTRTSTGWRAVRASNELVYGIATGSSAKGALVSVDVGRRSAHVEVKTPEKPAEAEP